MNKLDFLRRLDRELSALDQTERRELLAFYEERFYNGTIYENKTEEEVIAELESPEVIARNILSEYGITQREYRTYRDEYKEQPRVQRRVEERPRPQRGPVPQRPNNNNNYNRREEYNDPRPVTRDRGINTGSLVALIIVDLFILSWALPSLFSVTVSLVGSLFSYIGVFAFLNGGTQYDIMIFWFLTGAFILLFLFTLVVLEFFLWTCRKAILWHMKVLRFKKVNTWNKRLSRVGVEAWFKRHKFLRFIKNISGIAAIFIMAYSGFYLYAHYDEINELYIQQETLTDVERIDVSEAIDLDEAWEIIGDIDNSDVIIIPTTGTEIIVTRVYAETEGVEYSVNTAPAERQLYVNQDYPNQIFNFSISIQDIFRLISKDEITIEVPQELLLNNVKVKSSNGEFYLNSVNTEMLMIEGSNGKMTINDSVVGRVRLVSSNADMVVKNVHSDDKLTVITSNGRITVRDSEFSEYDLDTSNGKIILENLNVEHQDGVRLHAESSNGKLTLNEVYIATVDVHTSNGDIEYYNEDQTFNVEFTRDTSNGEVSTNVN